MIVAPDPKDPNDTDDFSLDWTNVLDTGETVSSVVVSVVSGGVTVNSSVASSPLTTARVSGGTAGTDAVILFRVTTSATRQLDESLKIHIEAR